MSTPRQASALRALPGAVLLFRYRDIPVFLHWSWAVIAVVALTMRRDTYSSFSYNLIEYVGLFGIVLLHEFGHALACRSVGGQVSHILLWPLGGVAHVQPPQRPGPVLWAIAAGPLVNLVLAPIALALWVVVPEAFTDLRNILLAAAAINVGLFVFNMLPIYPLDGGQILRALLWFGIGRELSLVFTAGLGLVISLMGATYVLWPPGPSSPEVWWLLVIAAYAAWQSWRGLRAALTIRRLAVGPRHPRARCPGCGEAPPDGLVFRCANDHLFDGFATRGRCPDCADQLDEIRCIFCAEEHAASAWDAATRPVEVRPVGSV